MQPNDTNKLDLPRLENSLPAHLGIKIEVVEDGYVKATMPVDSRTSRPSQPTDILNGGASLALAEIVAGFGSYPLCEKGSMPCGIQISASHVRMVPVGTHVEAIGKLIHRGRTQHIWNVDIISPDGKLVSTARVVNLIIKEKP